jgi:hypothetical protein
LISLTSENKTLLLKQSSLVTPIQAIVTKKLATHLGSCLHLKESNITLTETTSDPLQAMKALWNLNNMLSSTDTLRIVTIQWTILSRILSLLVENLLWVEARIWRMFVMTKRITLLVLLISHKSTIAFPTTQGDTSQQRRSTVQVSIPEFLTR